VDATGCGDVHVLRGVLFEMRADDADLDLAVRGWNLQAATDAQRLVVLGDLVGLRVVGIEVVLAVEDRTLGDLAVEREAELDRLFDCAAVRDRQRPRKREADRARLRVRRATEA